MSTEHFAHVAPDLQARYLGTYLGYVEHDGCRYELWRQLSAARCSLSWWGPPASGEPARRIAGLGAEEIPDALVDLWYRLDRPADQPLGPWWHPTETGPEAAA